MAVAVTEQLPPSKVIDFFLSRLVDLLVLVEPSPRPNNSFTLLLWKNTPPIVVIQAIQQVILHQPIPGHR